MKKSIIIFAILFAACHRTIPYNLGSNYYLDYDGNSFFRIYDAPFGTRGFVIESDVLQINNDSTFTIAMIKPIYKIDSIINLNNSVNNSLERDELRAKSALREYWIINKKIKHDLSNVSGPFTKENYLKERKRINISDTLQLISVEDFLNSKIKEK